MKIGGRPAREVGRRHGVQRRKRVDDAGHVPFYERPEIVDPILIEFLRR